MKVPKHPTVIRRLCQARVKQLKATCPVLAASLVIIRKRCGRPGCRCQRGQKHPGHYLTYKEKGKTRTVYVPLELIEEAKGWIMDRGTPSAQASDSGHLATDHRSSQDPCQISQTPGGKVVGLGRPFVKTVRHFWPAFNALLNQLPDTRFVPFIRYDKKFLTWWGLPGSRCAKPWGKGALP